MWKVQRYMKFLNQSRNISINKIKNVNNFEVSEEVMYALENKQPIVALESTIITHGMPYPENLNCALQVENIVRKQVI